MSRSAYKASIKLFALLLVVCLTLPLCSCRFYPVDYSDAHNWAYFNDGEDKDVDLFIICPAVDMGTNERFNMDIDNEDSRYRFTGALNMELGIYDGECTVYAPFYRQLTISAYEQGKISSGKNLDIAYNDVKTAFLYYMRYCNNGRPFVLAGFSQGAQLGLMLMKELFKYKDISRHLVASYFNGWAITQDDLDECPWLKMAKGENDTGCIVAFCSEAVGVTSSFFVPEGSRTLSINPLNWKTDSTYADASENLGACFTNYAGKIKKEIPEFSGAYIDPQRGTLKVPGADPDIYPAVLSMLSYGDYHLYDYQFFYRNLQKNVSVRTGAYLSKTAG